MTIEATKAAARRSAADPAPVPVMTSPPSSVASLATTPASTSPIPSPIAAYLTRSHDRHRRADDGAVATYIPELGRADPSWFGIAAVTLDGRIHEVGDSRVPFTIQSISKPLTYGLVLDDLGEDAVRARIGVEPTGEAFNAITLNLGVVAYITPSTMIGLHCMSEP